MDPAKRIGSVRRGLRAAVTAMTVATAVLVPALANADAVHLGYVWKRDADGNWEDKSNWNCIDPRTGNCSTNPAENKGYPNVAGDEAFFDGVNYTRRHTVFVSRTDIRVAKIVFGNSPGFTIQPGSGLAQIILNSGLASTPAEIVMNDRSTGDPSANTQLFVPFVNESPLIVTAGLFTQILVATDIGPFDFGLTIRGGGEVTLSRPTTYTGPTIVESGHLVLNSPDAAPTVMSRELVAGNGGPGLAQVFILRPNQLQDAMNVTLNFAWLTATADDQISDLAMVNRGALILQQSARFTARNVTMNRGGVESTSTARFVLTGDVTVGSQTGTSFNGFFGTVDLSSGSHRLTLNESMEIEAQIAGPGGLIKDGPGTLTFRNNTNGAVDSTYTGDTRIVQGTVDIFTTVVAMPRNLIIGQDGAGALVVLHQQGLSSATNVSVGPLGTFVVSLPSNRGQDIHSLAVASGGRVIQDGPSTLLRTASMAMIGGDVDVRQGSLTVIDTLSATSDFSQPASIHGNGTMQAPSQISTNDGPQAVDLRISTPLFSPFPFPSTRKDGTGVLELTGDNGWTAMTVASGTLRVGGSKAIPVFATLNLSDSSTPATLDMSDFDVTLASLAGFEGGRVLLGPHTLTVADPPIGSVYAGTIAGSGQLVKDGGGSLILSGSQPNTYSGVTTVKAGALLAAKVILGSTIVGPVIVNGGTLAMGANNQFADAVTVTLNAPGVFDVAGTLATIASLTGNGEVRLGTGTLTLGTGRSTVFSGAMNGVAAPAGLPPEKYFRLIKTGLSTFTLTGTVNLGDQAVVDKGVLTVDTQLNGSGVLVRNGSSLAGTGRIAGVKGASTLSATTGAAISPGHGNPGILHADAANITGAFLVVQVAGTAVGTGYDQLELTGSLTLGTGARLLWQPSVAVPKGSVFIVVRITGVAPVFNSFSGMPEGSTFASNGQTFQITYRGGDGNDIVVTALTGPAAVPTHDDASTDRAGAQTTTYHLPEGVTRSPFDEDVLIANPNDVPAPVTLAFTTDDGEQIVEARLVPAQSRLTVHVDDIPGLESASVSALVRSDSAVPIAVERSVFWDQTHYAGHTAAAAGQPSQDWFFADGAETATFHTLLTLANPNGKPTDVTVTFFRENDVPVLSALTMAPSSRLTVPASDFPDLANHAFGFTVHATQSIVAERSIYSGTAVVPVSSTGTASIGVTAPSTQWYFVDGATSGNFVDTFFLLSNPQSTAAHVTLTYVLDGGAAISVTKIVPANGRLTTNVNAESDPRLHGASFSTILISDVPIVAERSMSWLGESHTGPGAAEPGTKWILAEGRAGGAQKFQTYLLLANPQNTAASVSVTYLREAGAPVVQTYMVPAMSRLSIDVNAVPGMQESSFGMLVETTNEVPIVVERSMYWSANGVTFSGGTNVGGARVP